MFCAPCGTRLLEGASFCQRCGAEAPKAQPQPTSEATVAAAYCHRCGTPTLPQARFCASCGEKTVEPEQSHAEARAAQAPAGPGVALATGQEYAQFGPRLGGLLIDVIITMLLTVIPGVVVGLLAFNAAYPDQSFVTQEELENAQGVGILAGFGVYALISLIYHVMGWSSGQTWGMKALSLRMVTLTDPSMAPGFGRALLRYFVAIIPSTWAIGLGYLWAARDDRRQTWHDKVADTIVVVAK